jgi:protein O-mannosyl-transferase
MRRQREERQPQKKSGQKQVDLRLVTAGVCIFLIEIVAVSFGSALRCGFVNFDDNDYVYGNPNITNGLTFAGLRWALGSVHASNWHPLTTMSHMLDCSVYGVQPWGHHLTNVLLHAMAAVLLFFALRSLTVSTQSSTLNLFAGAFVAALFAVHPLRVESVAWISERKDVLSGVFFMATLWAYAIYARAEQRTLGKYLIVVFLFALGLMCKPTLVTLPFLLLLLDYWPLRRMERARSSEQGGKSEGRSAKREGSTNRSTPQQRLPGSGFNSSTSLIGLAAEKIPFIVLSVVSCVVTIVAQKTP